MTMVAKDKIHIQGKSVEHTMLHVGVQGEGQGMRGGGGGGREEGSGLQGEGRGSQENGKKKRRVMRMTFLDCDTF